MRELLESRGWVMYYDCTLPCGHKQHYTNASHPGYEVRARVKNDTAMIYYNNMAIAGSFYGYQLEEKLNEFVK